MAYALGPTLTKYREHGYKGVSLGRSFDDIDQTTPLKWAITDSPYLFTDSPEGKNLYVFTKQGVLVGLVRSYDGGADDYLEQLIGLFGKAAKSPLSNRARYAKAMETVTTVDYAFPETLVQIKFVDAVNVAGGFRDETHGTHVVVIDRKWGQELLEADLRRKSACMNWLRLVSKRLKESDWSADRAPSLPGCKVVTTDECVTYTDVDLYEIQKKELSDEALAAHFSLCASYGLNRSGDRPAPFLTIKFGRYRRKHDAVALKVLPIEGSNGGADALYETPGMEGLVCRVTSALLQNEFPPVGDTISTHDSDNPHEHSYQEWKSTTKDGTQWTVRCYSDDTVSVWMGEEKRL